MRTKTEVRVFLASPMDVSDERKAFRDSIQKLNKIIGEKLGIIFQVVGWEDSLTPGAGVDAQDVVNTQIRQDYDIFVALFKTRIGTKTHRSISGTVEEYELAQIKRNTHPEIKIFCYFFGPPDKDSGEIKEVKQKLKSDGVLYTEGMTISSFSEHVLNHFGTVLVQTAKTAGTQINRTQSKGLIQTSVSVAISVSSQILIVKRNRASKIGPGLWQIPGGKVETGETPSCAALREIREELGLELLQEQLLLISELITKSIKDNRPMRLLLFLYKANPEILNNISLNHENETWDTVDLAWFLTDSREYLGANKELLSILWREVYIINPLQTYLVEGRIAQDDRSSALDSKADEITKQNMLFGFLSLLGLVRVAPYPSFSSNYCEKILEEIISLSRNNKPMFENTEIDGMRDLLLPKSEYPVLQMHRQRMLFSHKSLMSILSCNAPLKNSIRNVVDILLFGEANGNTYLLLRWDFFAQQYQLISGGIKAEYPDSLSKEEKARIIFERRFSDSLFYLFDYHELGQIQTHHFSAGSIDNDPILRKYNVSAIVATPKNPFDSGFLEFVSTINEATKLGVEFCWDISDDQKKDMNFFRWCSLADLMDNNSAFEGHKVRGLQEIVASVGRKAIIDYSKRSICLHEKDICTDIKSMIDMVKEKTKSY